MACPVFVRKSTDSRDMPALAGAEAASSEAGGSAAYASDGRPEKKAGVKLNSDNTAIITEAFVKPFLIKDIFFSRVIFIKI